MKIITKLAGWLGYAKHPSHPATSGARMFNGASINRLTSDWLESCGDANSEIRTNVKTLRNRCRTFERDNDYVRRYLKLLLNNVLGHCGIGVQMKIKEMVRKEGKFVEQYDSRANKMIEKAWEKWSQTFCHRGGQFCLVDLQNIALRSVARDGAILIRKHYPQDNPFHFSLELIEIDQLDTDYNSALGNSRVNLGVEYDANNQLAAYHVLATHPGYTFGGFPQKTQRLRIPAREIIHLYMPERVGQSTGYPWLVSAMMRLRHLAAYEESEVVAARVAAAKMGFLVQTATSPGTYPGASAADGSKYMETEPGVVEQLPFGMDFKSFDPTHPTTAFNDFVKATLRGISAGLGVSYNSLANDLESVNYSSIRAGLREEQEEWKSIQGWFIAWFFRPVFEEWLQMALMSGAITDNGQTLPLAKFDKFNSPEFKPRRWGWVDPLNDLQASVLAVEKGFDSRRSIIAERGGDIEDVFGDQAADDALEDTYGLEFKTDSEMAANKQPTKPDKPDKVDPTED